MAPLQPWAGDAGARPRPSWWRLHPHRRPPASGPPGAGGRAHAITTVGARQAAVAAAWSVAMAAASAAAARGVGGAAPRLPAKRRCRPAPRRPHRTVGLILPPLESPRRPLRRCGRIATCAALWRPPSAFWPRRRSPGRPRRPWPQPDRRAAPRFSAPRPRPPAPAAGSVRQSPRCHHAGGPLHRRAVPCRRPRREARGPLRRRRLRLSDSLPCTTGWPWSQRAAPPSAPPLPARRPDPGRTRRRPYGPSVAVTAGLPATSGPRFGSGCHGSLAAPTGAS